MDFKKTPVKCHKFTWASVTTFIENILPIRYKGILIAKLINVWCIYKFGLEVSAKLFQCQVLGYGWTNQSIHYMVFCRQKIPNKNLSWSKSEKVYTRLYLNKLESIMRALSDALPTGPRAMANPTLQLHFGCGRATPPVNHSHNWPSGRMQNFLFKIEQKSYFFANKDPKTNFDAWMILQKHVLPFNCNDFLKMANLKAISSSATLMHISQSLNHGNRSQFCGKHSQEMRHLVTTQLYWSSSLVHQSKRVHYDCISRETDRYSAKGWKSARGRNAARNVNNGQWAESQPKWSGRKIVPMH